VLEEVRQRGSTIAAMRETYVNRYGGLVLDLPAWLVAIESQLASLQKAQDSSEASTHSYRLLLGTALEGGRNNPEVAPETMAELRTIAAQEWIHAPTSDRGRVIETAIQAYEAALHVYTRARYPRQYARVLAHLGNAYSFRVAGEHAENIEHAIACNREALRVLPGGSSFAAI